MNLTPMIVEWLDSRRGREASVFFSDEELDNFPLATVRTIGFGRILKDKVNIVVEFYPENSTQDEQARCPYSIPMDCVLKIIEQKSSKILYAKNK